MLVQAAAHFAKAKVYHGMVRCTDKASVAVEVSKLPSQSAKLKWLKDQFKILTIGYGWKECAVPFSKKGDASIGTV